MLLEVKNLHVSVGGKTILAGFDLSAKAGEVHAVMGPNGVGKSTLAAVLTGHPAFIVEKGSVTFNGEDVLAMPIYERARKGIFLAFQHPISVPGLKISEYLKNLYSVHKGEEISVRDFRKLMNERLAEVGLNKNVLVRDLNEGFSGGEKKRFELLQLALIQPKLAILDEIDSGLDVDALAVVQTIVSRLRAAGTLVLVITHYKRLLDAVRPDKVHLLIDGSIHQVGDSQLADAIDARGYVAFKPAAAAPAVNQ